MTVYFDIDTQIDFVFPSGALYVPGAERLLPALRRLNEFGASKGRLVSTVCAHDEDDPEFRQWPAHCVVGTPGQMKPSATIQSPQAVVPPDPAPVAIEGARQIVVQKRELDLFSNPNLATLLETLAADRYVVYGVVTEYCVRFAALGLLATGKPVSLVTDAIRTLHEADGQRTIEEFTSRGGVLSTVDEVCRG